MAVAAFGPGIAIVTRTDVTPSTPVNVGYANSLSLSFKGTTKELYGQNQFPLVVARGTVKATGKLVAAEDTGIALNSMFIGQTFSTGGIIWNINEAHTIPGTPFQVTVTNSATFDVDLGVYYATTLLPFQKVATPSAVGQYSVSAGVYTFYSSDTGAAVLITYSSTTAVTTVQNLPIANQLIGTAPTFQLDYYTTVNQPTPKTLIYRCYACIADSVSWDYKLEDFGLPTFEFALMQNSAGKVMGKYYPEVS
jgi:hypothetical protein